MSPWFADVPAPAQGFMRSLDTHTMLLFGGVAAGVLLLAILLVALRRRGKKPVNLEGGLGEDLSQYPPAPDDAGPRRLAVHGRPVRLRLVVVAPAGKQAFAGDGEVESLLDGVLRGLGQVARQDRPRIRIWPPQLSQQGFAPTFFRLMRCPDPAVRRRTGSWQRGRRGPAAGRSCWAWRCGATTRRRWSG